MIYLVIFMMFLTMLAGYYMGYFSQSNSTNKVEEDVVDISTPLTEWDLTKNYRIHLDHIHLNLYNNQGLGTETEYVSIFDFINILRQVSGIVEVHYHDKDDMIPNTDGTGGFIKKVRAYDFIGNGHGCSSYDVFDIVQTYWDLSPRLRSVDFVVKPQIEH